MMLMSSPSLVSEVEAGPTIDPLRGYGVDVPLSQNDVLVTLHLDFEPVFRVEEHLVPHLDRTDMRPDSHGFSPRQPPGHLCGGRDQDPGSGPAFTIGLRHLDQYSVGKDGDRDLRIVR